MFPEGAIVVAGGSGGIGRAICVRLAEAGADVALTYRSRREPAEKAAAAVRAAGRRASIHPVDLADAGAVAEVVDRAAAEHGAVHSVVHAVGSDIAMRFISELGADEWKAVVHADADGFFHLVRAALPHLRRARGSIVAITSAGLERFPARDILSVAPKAAIEAVIRGLAREEGRHGVRANSVAVGVVDAGMFQRLSGAAGELSSEWVAAATRNAALRRLGTAEEVADAVVFLASARASYITGQRLVVDGGYSV